MKYHKRIFGFTLAEVLITLGIVGVVAALTIPSLISKYNEYVTIIALKKTYAELTEAIKRSELVNGDFRDWDYSYDWRKGGDFAKRYIFPYLSQNYTQCTRYNCFAGQGCWKNVSGNPGSCKEGGSGYDCGLAIEKNKWKIPDKYPIKF